MTKSRSSANREGIARRLALSLDSVADRLDAARDAREFVAALRANGTVWRRIGRAAGRYGWAVPQRMMELSLSVLEGAHRGVDDHQVEALIHVNRRLSRQLLESGNGASSTGAASPGLAS